MTFHYSASSQPANHFIRLDRIISINTYGDGRRYTTQEWWVRVDDIVEVMEYRNDYTLLPPPKAALTHASVRVAHNNTTVVEQVSQTCQQVMALIAGTFIAGEEDDN